MSQSPSPSPSTSSAADSPAWINDAELMDPMQEFYITAYSPEELRTFHCDRVRKMPISGLDPSMLIGFLCRNERDWKDLRARLADVCCDDWIKLY